jgi:outer membrane protein OmpA-like peptidoglycan-associated protein
MEKSERPISDKYGLILKAIFIILFASSPSLGDSPREENFSEQVNSPFSLPIGNYVIAGVFRYFDNAVKYSDYLFLKGHETRYGYYPAKGYFYVYLKYFDSYKQARSACLQWRKHEELNEAWIFVILDNHGSREVINLVTNEQVISSEQREWITQPKDDPPVSNTIITDITKAETQNTSDVPLARHYNFLFRTYDTRNHAILNAKIEIVDPERLHLISLADANKIHSIERKSLAKSSLLLISQSFGYRKIERMVDLNNIIGAGPDLSLKGDTVHVNFELVRLKAGDVVIMYNVYFFNNSAVIKPESRYEINQLLEMLQENERYKIKLHGHTNGNNYGPIIKMRDNDTNFFELSRNNKEGKGSAKELSKDRANTIYRYLVSKGIDKKRMQVIGWGGRKMLFNATDPNAQKNVRVEVEILAD